MSIVAEALFCTGRSYVRAESHGIVFIEHTRSRSIRVVGTHNTVNKVFHLVSMEVYYIQKPFALVGDLYGREDTVVYFYHCE
jgi:hypothetical protein